MNGEYILDTYGGDGVNFGTSANPVIFKETATETTMEEFDAPWAGMAFFPYYSPFFERKVYNKILNSLSLEFYDHDSGN